MPRLLNPPRKCTCKGPPHPRCIRCLNVATFNAAQIRKSKSAKERAAELRHAKMLAGLLDEGPPEYV